MIRQSIKKSIKKNRKTVTSDFLAAFFVKEEQKMFNNNLTMPNEVQNAMESNDWSFIHYALEFEKKLRTLEYTMHHCDDPETIATHTLTACADFYEATWCGAVEADLFKNEWTPIWWHSRERNDTLICRYLKMKKIMPNKEWIEALHQGKAIVIPDTSVYKESNPKAYETYQNLNIKSVLAYPFWKNPSGFIIIINPTKYMKEIGFMQTLSYVIHSSISAIKLVLDAQKIFTVDEIKNDNDVVINLFSTLEIHTLNHVLKEEQLNSPKISKILTYLILHPNQYHSPRRLCDAIWPEEVIDNPGTKIKNLVYRLHTSFSDISEHKLIISTNRGYQLNPELNIVTDLQLFDSYWLMSQKAMSVHTKIELLKKLTDIYKGSLLISASGEHWILGSDLGFRNKYTGIVNELLKTFFEAENYSDTERYALKALSLDNANKDAYYWLIRAMNRLGSSEMAKGELKTAEKFLLFEEYQVLLDELSMCDS